MHRTVIRPEEENESWLSAEWTWMNERQRIHVQEIPPQPGITNEVTLAIWWLEPVWWKRGI
jgi:hypothetical protein